MRSFVLVSLILKAASQPNIPSTWTSSECDFTVDGADFICSFTSCEAGDFIPWTMVQDDDNQRRVMMVDGKNKFAPVEFAGTPSEWFNISIFSVVEGTFNQLNTLCYPEDFSLISSRGNKRHIELPQTSDKDTSGYSNLFSWVPESKYQGNVSCEVFDESCELWSLKTIKEELLLVAYGDRPVVFNYTILNQTQVSFIFFTFEADSADATVFDVLNITECYDPPTCAKNGTLNLIDQDLYIFHPVDQFDIAGQDIGDALGDAFFVCEEQITGAGDNDYEWISHWKVRYDATTIGQYLNCNGYPSDCQGTNNYYVGREAALGLGYPMAGQCDTNNLTGNWLSLPIGGDCSYDSSLILGINCTWSATRIKTINSTCLFDDLDFNTACRLDARAPFYNAQNTFLMSFESPSNGGCLDISPPLSPSFADREDYTLTSTRLSSS